MADNYLITGYWGEPHVTAENDRGINAAMFGPGRFVLPVGEQFRAEYIGNNTVRIYDGKLMDNGAAAGIPAGEYVDLLIANAGQGMKRNDLIVFQYKQDSSTLIESGTFVVIQGEETSGTASDPTLTQGDLLTGKATFDQMALWRVSVSGATISAPVQVFSVRSMHFYWGSYKGNIDSTDLNGLYWITTAKCTGTFPSGMVTYGNLEATGRYQKLTYFSEGGVSCVKERYYVNNKWYAWQRTDSIDSVPKFDLLWSNGSPGNGWGATPLSLTHSGYTWLMITFRSHKDSAYYQRTFIPVDLQSGLSTSQRSRLETVMGGGYYRDVSITDAGLSFTTATKYDGSATNNEYCTPMQIHGCNLT